MNKNSDIDEWTQLAILSANGDEPAFDRLLNESRPWMINQLIKWGCDPHLAEDIAQDVAWKLAKQIQHYELRIGSFRTWARSILRHQMIDKHRPKRNKKETSWPTNLNPVLTVVSPLDQLDAAEETAQVREAIADLPADQQKVIALRIIREEDWKDTAEIMAVPMGTAVSCYRRAVQRLQKRMRKAA